MVGKSKRIGCLALTIACLFMLESTMSKAKTEADETKTPVTFTGGHEIGKNDFGRPVVLMAAALGVKPDEFRKAFSGVRPARGRGPTREEAQRNKEALMKVL